MKTWHKSVVTTHTMTKVKELIVKTLTRFHPSFKSHNPFRIKQINVKNAANIKKRKILWQNDAVRFTVWSGASVNVHGSYSEVIAVPLQKLCNKSKWKWVPYKKAVYLDSTPVSNHRTTLEPWRRQNRFLLRIVRTFRFELKIADSGREHGLGHCLRPPEKAGSFIQIFNETRKQQHQVQIRLPKRHGNGQIVSNWFNTFLWTLVTKKITWVNVQAIGSGRALTSPTFFHSAGDGCMEPSW